MVCVAMQCIVNEWMPIIGRLIVRLVKIYLKSDEIVPIVFILNLCKKMITTNETACLTPRSFSYVPVAAAIVP